MRWDEITMRALCNALISSVHTARTGQRNTMEDYAIIKKY